MADDRMQFVTIICDGPAMWTPLLPWLLVILSAAPGIRCIFLPRRVDSVCVAPTARRCYLTLHVLTGAGVAVLIFLLVPFLLSLRGILAPTPAFHVQCINISHALWPVLPLQLLVAHASAMVVFFRTGVQPRLWHPRVTLLSIVLVALAQAGVLSLVMYMMQP